MEDYKKKYEAVLKRAKDKLESAKVFEYKDKQIAHDIKTTIFDVLPELEEKNYENIKKALKKLVNASSANSFFIYGIEKQDVIDWLSELKTPQGQQEEIERAYKNSDEVQYKQGYVKALKDCAKEFGDKYNDALDTNDKFNIYRPTISYNDTLSILEKLEDEINKK